MADDIVSAYEQLEKSLEELIDKESGWKDVINGFEKSPVKIACTPDMYMLRHYLSVRHLFYRSHHFGGYANVDAFRTAFEKSGWMRNPLADMLLERMAAYNEKYKK